MRTCDPSCKVILAHRAKAGTVVTTNFLEENAKSAGFELAKTPGHKCLYPSLNTYGQDGRCFILRNKEM